MRNTTLGALLFVTIGACRAPENAGGPRGPEPTVLARVDGEPVSMASYKCWLADTAGQSSRDEYLQLWLFEREARRRGVSASDEEVERALESLWSDWIQNRLGGDASALDAELARQGHDRESFRRWFHWQKRRELLAARLIHLDRTIDEQKLRRRFEQQYGPAGVRTEVRVLVLTRARLSQELRQAGSRVLTAAELDKLLMEKAQALVDRARTGENFESIVRAESNDLAVRKNGGLLRDEEWRVRGTAFVRAVEAAELGTVQPPVENSSGIDVFLVHSREKTPFDAVREELTRALQDEPPSLDEIVALEKRLRADSRIELAGG